MPTTTARKTRPTVAPAPVDPTDIYAEAIAAERATIGALLVAGPGVQREILNMLTPGDFYDPRCGWLFTVAQQMRAAGTPIDKLTLAGFVPRAGLITDPARRAALDTELHELTETPPTAAHGAWYAQQVVEHAARRRTVQAAIRISQMAGGAELADLHEKIVAELGLALVAIGRARGVQPAEPVRAVVGPGLPERPRLSTDVPPERAVC
jgi:replicative DNA helicase